MAHTTELTAADGHELSAYLAEPAGPPRGGIVVIQEIFGVTSHIRAVADRYAAQGYLAAAPALFDRQESGVDVPYADLQRAFGYMKGADLDHALLDIGAAVQRVSSAGKVGVVGYCWGGLLAYLSACRLPIAAAVAYYGGGIHQHLAARPVAPIMFHFGERDSHIPLSAVAEIQAAVPQGIYHLYPAEHGFNCSDRASFEPKSAQLAFERSIEFLRLHVG